MRAAVVLLAFLGAVALQSNACDVKGPIDIMADKVCSFKGECEGKQICLKCVTKMFKNKGDCNFDKVEFPPELNLCQASVKDKCFVDKLNELAIDKYVDKIEELLEKIPALKGKVCTKNADLDAWMNDSGEEEGVMSQCSKTDFGRSMAEAGGSNAVGEVMDAGKDMGCNFAKRNGNFCMKEFKCLIDRICGKAAICDKIKTCMEQIVGYIIQKFAPKRRRRWIDALKQRNILSRPSLSAEVGSFSMF